MADWSKASAGFSASIKRQLDCDSAVEDDGEEPSRPARATTSASLVSGMQELQARIQAESSSAVARNAAIVNRALGLGMRSGGSTAKPCVTAVPTSTGDTLPKPPGVHKRKLQAVCDLTHHQQAVAKQKVASNEGGITLSQKLTLMPREGSLFEMNERSSSEHSVSLGGKGLQRARRKPIARRQQEVLSDTEESDPDSPPLPKRRAVPRMISRTKQTLFGWEADKTEGRAASWHKAKRTQGSSDDEDDAMSALRRKATWAAFQFSDHELTSDGGKKVAHKKEPGIAVCGPGISSEKRQPATHRRLARPSKTLGKPSTLKRSKSKQRSDGGQHWRREDKNTPGRKVGGPAVCLLQSTSSDYSYAEDDDDETSSNAQGWGYDASRRDLPGRTRRLRAAQWSNSSDSDEADDTWYPIKENHPVDDGTTMPFELCAESKRAELPASIARYLFDHQKVGVKWLYQQYAKRIGDDMGLGKTLQTVAFIAALLGLTGLSRDDNRRKRHRMQKAKKLVRLASSRTIAGLTGREDITDAPDVKEVDCGPALIVVRAPTVRGWIQTFEEWTICNVAAIQSDQTTQERDDIMQLAKFGGYDVIVVTTTLATKINWPLGPRTYLVGIIDEVHCEFKNKRNVAYTQIQPLKESANCMFGLTGTPLQNEAFKETHSLLTLCTNAKLGTETEFQSKFKAIERGRKKNADRETVALGRKTSDAFKHLIGQYCLRRTKDEIQILAVGKHVMTVMLELSPLQRRLYQTVLSFADVRLLEKANSMCKCSHGTRERLKYKACCGRSIIQKLRGLGFDRYRTLHDDERRDCFFAATAHDGAGVCQKNCPSCYQFAVLHQLIKIANHPSLLLFDPSENSEEKKEQMRLFAELVFGKDELKERGHGRASLFLEKCRTDECEKMRALEILLKQFAVSNLTYYDPYVATCAPSQDDGDHTKVLIFSRFTKMLDIIQAHIISQNYTYVRLDGTTSEKDRRVVMDTFNDPDSDVFLALVSTLAGGTGINLQAANKVIQFDVSWNPSHDEQAQDRSYRIGQHREVTVYRFVSRGTIEELAYMRQVYKKKTNSTAFEGGKGNEGGIKFDAVKGDFKGELFGVENLLKYSDTSFIDKINICKKRRSLDSATTRARLRTVHESDMVDADESAILAAIGVKPMRSDDHVTGNYEDDVDGGAHKSSARLIQHALPGRESCDDDGIGVGVGVLDTGIEPSQECISAGPPDSKQNANEQPRLRNDDSESGKPEIKKTKKRDPRTDPAPFLDCDDIDRDLDF